MILIRLAILFGLLGMIIFGASPAHASICDKYDKPITEAGFSAYAEEVKDLFPVRYRSSLDRVVLEVSHETEDQLYMARTGREFSISVSAGYLKANCVMGLWTLLNGAKAADPSSSHSLTTDAINKVCKDKSARRACVLDFLEEAEGMAQNAADQQQFYHVMTPLLEQAMQSSFRFALAHEFAHVINETQPTPYRKLAKLDNELAADLQALTILASGRVWHVSDSLLFSGRQLFESLVGTLPLPEDSHDGVACRAQRSNAIRTKVSQELWEISQWRSRTDMSLAFSPMALSGSSIGSTVVLAVSGCPGTMPAEVLPMIDDLSRLSAWAKAQPKQIDATQAVPGPSGLKMKSEFGTIVRDSMTLSASVGPFFQIITKIGGTTLGTRDVTGFGGTAKSVEALIHGRLLSVGDNRKAGNILAVNHYLSSRKGSSFRDNAKKLRRTVENNVHQIVPDTLDLMVLSIARSMDGDCESVMDTARVAMLALLQPMREIQSFVTLSESMPFSNKSANPSKALDKEFEKLVNDMPKADEKQIRTCRNNVAEVGKHMAVTFGWKE